MDGLDIIEVVGCIRWFDSSKSYVVSSAETLDPSEPPRESGLCTGRIVRLDTAIRGEAHVEPEEPITEQLQAA